MGNVCIFKNRAGHYYASADFIHYPDEGRLSCVGLSSIHLEDPMLSRFEICLDPEQLKDQINKCKLHKQLFNNQSNRLQDSLYHLI